MRSGPTIATAWSHGLGLRTPIVNAPMGGVAGGHLAAAVSGAGGLGMIGMGSAGTAAALARELTALGDVRPFGIGLVDWVCRAAPELLDMSIAARPTLLSVSFGDTFEWVEPAHAAGIHTVTQVCSAVEAQRAQHAGIDVVVARGLEGGGHGDPREPRVPLLDAVLAAVDIPVLAAGGIATGHDVAAALMAGAAGVWVGTTLSACVEASTPAVAKDRLLRAVPEDTVLTQGYDRINEWPWPQRFPSRVLRNRFTDRWSRDLHERVLGDADRAGLRDWAPPAVDAGMGVGAIVAVESASAVIAGMTAQAARVMDSGV